MGTGKTRAEELGPDPIGSGTLGKYLRARRSIRAYRPEPVEKDTLLTLLDTARYSATGSNAQLVGWIVIHNPDTIHTLAGMTIDWMREHTHDNHPISRYLPAHIENWDQGIDGICRNAPEILVAHVPAGNRMAAIDAIIALTYVDVAAPAYGVGTCWAGLLTMAARDSRPLMEALGIPAGREIGYAMLAGYPKYRPARIPPGRRPLNVSWME
jgi:nitroreductase